jgi:hypothetical protein
MPTTTRDRIDEIQALEELWAAPATEEPELTTKRRRELPLVRGHVLACGWLGFFVWVQLFQPLPEPGMDRATWAIAMQLGIYGLLLFAGVIWVYSSATAFAAVTAAGGLLIPIAVSCRAAEHHLGNWWLAELTVAIAFTAVACVGMGQRLRGREPVR